MEMVKEVNFESQTFSKRLKSMLKVDFKRMFTTPLFYIMLGISIAIPILVLVMTTMMDGTTTVDPNTGVEKTIEGFTSVWQAIATSTDANASASMSMDLTTMCNINMMYFILSVLVCIFVANDFRSGYSKNLFTVRSKKNDYVISKTLVCFVAGGCMILAYFVGAMLGGAMSGLSFDLGGVGVSNVVMCIISKVLLVAVFVPLFLVMSVVGKQKLWLSIVCSLGISMLLFTMIPMITPLDATFTNVILCLVGGVLFSVGIGAISNTILRKTSLV